MGYGGCLTLVTRGVNDGQSTQGVQTDQVANTASIFLGNSLFVIAIGVGDDLGDLGVGLREQILIVDQIRLVLVVRCGRLISIGDEWAVDKSLVNIGIVKTWLILTQHHQ